MYWDFLTRYYYLSITMITLIIKKLHKLAIYKEIEVITDEEFVKLKNS